MRFCLIIISSFLLPFIIQGQNVLNGPISEGRAQIESVNNDPWASLNNPAVLAQIENNSIALAYRNSYLFTELGTAGASFQWKLKKSGIGLGFSRYGYSLANESQLNFSYALLLAEGVSMGLSFSPQIISFQNTGTLVYPNASLGFYAKATDKIDLAAGLKNPFSQEIDALSKSYTQSILQVGAAYHLVDNIDLFTEFEKNFDRPIRMKFAGEYRLEEMFAIRAGVATMPIEISYGVGVLLKAIRFDLALRQDPRLGSSGQVGLSFDLKGKKSKSE